MDEQIKGRIESIVYHNNENDYTVLEISDDKENLITAVGNIAMPGEGEEVTLVGYYTYHKEFGKQFAFTSYEKSLPREIEGIIQYLSSGMIKGVGPVTALKIVNRFGLDTFDIIEQHPDWLADIPGITRKKAAAIAESFMAQQELYGVMMFFKDYLDASSINKVYRRFGSGAVGIIRDNPYILCGDDFSHSFETVDRIAASFGFGRDREERINAGIRYILDYNARVNGHTCLPKAKLVAAVARTLEQEEARVAELMESFIEAGDYSEYKMNDSVYVMTDTTDEAERTITSRLYNLLSSVEKIGRENIPSLIERAEAYSAISYARLQREAMYRCLDGGVTIITGGPGTGKTTIIKGLISIFENLGMDTVLCAPTGRAAKRMSEATSEEAKTIHRLLEMEKTEAGETRFNRNQRTPLDEKVVIVDEVSMVDLSLMASLLVAMRRGSRLILIGDSDQLPSVGAGNILDDLISSGVIPVVRLTEIFRQSEESLIVSNAHRINSGEMPILSATDKDFFFLKRENESSISDTISSLITERLPRRYGASIRDNIQVISPSKKGSGGIELLNRALQEKINPPAKFKKEKQAHSTVFREGDRVMQIANDYEIEWERGNETGMGVFNGDIGVIESIIEKDGYMNIRFDDRLVKYEFDKLDELELAYAITVHKSQGSEYPVVIMPVYKCAPMLMSRNLLYTAITRAKRMVILVGRQDIVRIMVDNDKEVERYTTLSDRLSTSF